MQRLLCNRQVEERGKISVEFTDYQKKEKDESAKV